MQVLNTEFNLKLHVLSQVCIGTFQFMTTSTKDRGSSMCQGRVTVNDSKPAVIAVASDRNETK